MFEQISDFKHKEPQKVISENGDKGAGEVVCSCGHQFTHDLFHNMKGYMGFIYPVCPECGVVPSSTTRQIDL